MSMDDDRDDQPFENGANGHGPDGRWTHGNPGGPGAPPGRSTALRRYLQAAIKPDDIAMALAKLLAIIENKDGKARPMEVIKAVELLFSQAAGKPASAELQERIEDIEKSVLSLRDAMGLDQR
jgi:hypothetical protein